MIKRGWVVVKPLVEMPSRSPRLRESIEIGECSVRVRSDLERGLQSVGEFGQCECFGSQCTPESPLGAPMVSSEGACAAYYRYARAAATSSQ